MTDDARPGPHDPARELTEPVDRGRPTGTGETAWPDAPDDLGGEPACALNRVCTECGAINDTPRRTCWRCGHDPGPDEL